MADRYFVNQPIESDHARLSGAEAHHLAHVMRARPGDEVTLFDGSGAEFFARIERVGRAEIELAVIARQAIDRELRVPLTLAVALPKGDRQRWLVEKGVELGITRLVPLETARCNERPSSALVERLRRAVAEASKQCGRNRLMEIEPPRPFADLIISAPAEAPRLIAHPGGQSLREALDEDYDSADARRAAEHALLAVGPEGGFTDAEIEAAHEAGWRIVGLGPRTLRVETAAIALAAVVIDRLQADARA